MKTNRIIGLALPMMMSGYVAAQNSNTPNIILILTDDQGYGDFSCTGNPYVHTPNMDSLKENGKMFTNFHVSAVSAPTRAALMTGRYAYRTGVTGVNKSKVNMFADEKTIAEYMKDAGYDTGLFGKWHLGYNYPMRPIDQGFDEYCAWDEMQWLRTNPVMEENGKNVQYKGRFLTDVVFEKANNYMEKKVKENKPFFMYLATYLPHTHHDGLQVPTNYSLPFDKYPELVWHTRQSYGMVEKVDEQLGLLLEKIHELGIEENTLIVFGTDNGPADCYPGQNRSCQNRYNAGFRGMKGDVYEGGIRTPWFFVWKNKIKPGTSENRFSAHVDILPTLVDIVGGKIDESRVLDGNSFKPLLFDDKSVEIPSTRYFYHFVRGDMNILPKEWNNSCYIENGYKLVDGKELYNIEDDKFEKHDLAVKMPDKVKYMRKKQAEYIREQLNERNCKYQPNIIGAPEQDMVNLMYFEIVDAEKGWPVNVIAKSSYDITINDIQVDDIAEGAKFVVEAQGKKWEKVIDKKCETMVFEDVDLPLGEYFLRVYIEGDKFPKRFKTWTSKQGRYHTVEFGHRLVTVRNNNGTSGDMLQSTMGLYDGLLD